MVLGTSFALLATESCSTKRITVTDGVAGTPTSYLTGLLCTPAVTSERYFSQGHTQEREFVGSPFEGKVVMLQGDLDITKKDIFVYDGVDYSIVHVERRPYPPLNEVRMLVLFQDDAK